MTVLATIHQPSADLFMMFDRVIVLSEGYTVYSGPPSMVATYFEQFGLKMGRYSNPADKLSVIAAEPTSVLTNEATIIDLHNNCKVFLHQYLTISNTERELLKDNFTTKLKDIVKNRQVSFCK